MEIKSTRSAVHPHLYRLCLAPACAVASFVVTRGSDGSLIGFITSFVAIGVAYCAIEVQHYKSGGLAVYIAQLIASEACAVTAMLFHSELDEMAGMLYLFIPGAVASIVVVAGAAASAVRWTQRGRKY